MAAIHPVHGARTGSATAVPETSRARNLSSEHDTCHHSGESTGELSGGPGQAASRVGGNGAHTSQTQWHAATSPTLAVRTPFSLSSVGKGINDHGYVHDGATSRRASAGIVQVSVHSGARLFRKKTVVNRSSTTMSSAGMSSADGDGLITTLCKNGRGFRALPLILGAIGLVMTHQVTRNSAADRLEEHISEVHQTWQNFVRRELSDGMAHQILDPGTNVKRARYQRMFQPDYMQDDAGLDADPLLRTLIHSRPATPGVLGAFLTRTVRVQDHGEVSEQLRAHHGMDINVWPPVEFSEEELAAFDPNVQDTLRQQYSATVTHAQPSAIAPPTVGTDSLAFPSFTGIIAEVALMEEPLASFPLGAASGLLDILGLIEETGHDISNAIVVISGFQRLSEEFAAIIRAPGSSEAEVRAAFAAPVLGAQHLFGTVSVVWLPGDFFPAALNKTLTGSRAFDHAGPDDGHVEYRGVGTIVVVEDISSIAHHSSAAARAQTKLGWVEDPTMDAEEEARLECGTGGALVWGSLGSDHEVACQFLRTADAPLYFRAFFNYHGRLWVFHVATLHDVEGHRLSADDEETISFMWAVGIAMSSFVLLVGVVAVEHLLGHTEKEVERGRRRAAEAARAAHEDTVSYACHELRNPLHVVSATAEFIHTDISDTVQRLGEEHAEASGLSSILTDVQTVIKSGRMMQTVVDDLLDYARLRRGQLEIVPTAVDVRSLARGIVTSHRQMAVVPFTEFVDPGVPDTCFVDELRLRQVVQNGVTNACKYVTEGTISLRVRLVADAEGNEKTSGSSEAKSRQGSLNGSRDIDGSADEADRTISSREGTNKVSPASQHSTSHAHAAVTNEAKRSSFRNSRSTVTGAYDDHQVEFLLFEVVDTGPGLRGVSPGTLFEPFEQGRGAKRMRHTIQAARVSRSKAGTGLGLAIAYQLVSLMGGKIGLSDRTDTRGTRFWFTLPILCRSGSPGPLSRTTESNISNVGIDMTSPVTSPAALRVVTPGSHASRGRLQLSPLDGKAATGKPTDALPAPLRAGLRVAGPRAEATLNLHGYHFLVVDDERLNRRVAARFLRSLHATSTELADGDEVEGYIRANHEHLLGPRRDRAPHGAPRLDAILMDIQMIRSSGDIVVAKLRSLGLEIPVIACTGNAGARDAQRYREAGFSAILTKPFSLPKLAGVLSEAFSGDDYAIDD